MPVFSYLKGWLLKMGSPQAVVTYHQTTADVLTSLGFTINVPKSHLTPTQMLLFIGAILDTVQFCAYPPKQCPGYSGQACQVACVGPAMVSEVPVTTASGVSL